MFSVFKRLNKLEHQTVILQRQLETIVKCNLELTHSIRLNNSILSEVLSKIDLHVDKK